MTITLSYKRTLDSNYRITDDKENYTKRQLLNNNQEFMYNLSEKYPENLSYNPKQSLWSNGIKNISLKDIKGSSRYPREINLDLTGKLGLSNSEKQEFLGILNSLTDRVMLPRIKIEGGACADISDIEDIAKGIIKLKNNKSKVKLELSREFTSKLDEPLKVLITKI